MTDPVPDAELGRPLPRPHAPGTLLAVLVGGALGTLARLLITTATTAGTDAAGLGNAIDDVLALTDGPLAATLAINLFGTLVLGVVAGATWPPRLDWLRAGLGTGFCGAFTTFSYVMLAFAVLGFGSPWAWALLVLGIVGGLLLAAVGHMIGRGLWPARTQPAGGDVR